MSAEMKSSPMGFPTNAYLNKKFPLATCPVFNVEEKPSSAWYIEELSRQLLAALYLEDDEAFRQIQARMAVHWAAQNTFMPATPDALKAIGDHVKSRAAADPAMSQEEKLRWAEWNPLAELAER